MIYKIFKMLCQNVNPTVLGFISIDSFARLYKIL